MPDLPVRDLVVIDDDEVSRELMLLFAAEAGFRATACESGDAELSWLRTGARIPHVILADMRMPGTSGTELAHQLRQLCGPATLLLAISATPVLPAELLGFDGFLLKPFTPAELLAALKAAPEAPASASKPLAPAPELESHPDEALSPATYSSLAASMPRQQLRALYTLCLDDAVRRIELMRGAASAGDAEAYTQGAHAIKGGCGMVGALQLAALAADMEQQGLAFDGNIDTLDRFLTATDRLRRILDAQST